MEEKANNLPSAVPFLPGLLTDCAVHNWGQGIFPHWIRQLEELFRCASCLGDSTFRRAGIKTHHPGGGGQCCQSRPATSHTEFLIQILCYGLIICNSRKHLAGAATAGDHFENSICKYEWCTSLQWRTNTKMTKLQLVVKSLSWHVDLSATKKDRQLGTDNLPRMWQVRCSSGSNLSRRWRKLAVVFGKPG